MSKKIRNLGTIVLAILGIPLLIMEFSSAVKWSLADFVLAGILLFGSGLAGIIILELVPNRKWKIVLVLLLLVLLLLVWAELAVGIFNSRFSGN